MVLDFGVSDIPMPVFVVIHLVALVIGAFFAWKAFSAGRSAFGWAFALFGIAEILYIGYHVDVTTFLLSHTLAEVCDLVAFILVFVGIGTLSTTRSGAAGTSTRM
jgi:hypothetical protein